MHVTWKINWTAPKFTPPFTPHLIKYHSTAKSLAYILTPLLNPAASRPSVHTCWNKGFFLFYTASSLLVVVKVNFITRICFSKNCLPFLKLYYRVSAGIICSTWILLCCINDAHAPGEAADSGGDTCVERSCSVVIALVSRTGVLHFFSEIHANHG